jgi:hypothetical protein
MILHEVQRANKNTEKYILVGFLYICKVFWVAIRYHIATNSTNEKCHQKFFPPIKAIHTI